MFPFVMSLPIKTLFLGSFENSLNCVVAVRLLKIQEVIIFLSRMGLLMIA